MGKSENQKDTHLGYVIDSNGEQHDFGDTVNREIQVLPQTLRERVLGILKLLPKTSPLHRAPHKHTRYPKEKFTDFTRYHHYPLAFRINMCETDIKAWLEREGYNGHGNRRLSRNFIEYLKEKYGLDHDDVLMASKRVRYRIHG